MPINERAEQGSTSSANTTKSTSAPSAMVSAESKTPTNPGSRAAPESKTSGLIDQLRNQATDRLADQKDRAVASLSTVVEAVRQAGRQLAEKNSTVATIAETTATHLERWSSTLKQREVPQLFDDLKQYARRRPGVFLGVSAAAGLLAVRFLKSSDADPRHLEDRIRSSGGDQGTRRSSLPSSRPALAADRPPLGSSVADPASSTPKGEQPSSAKLRG
jgi:hypothetical protein